MPECCDSCWYYDECTKRGICCDECDFFRGEKCGLNNKTADDWDYME